MEGFQELFSSDLVRYGADDVDKWTRRFLYYFRKVSTCGNPFLLRYYEFRYNRICEKRGIEIPRIVEIGKGLYVGHFYNVTINPQAKLGQNINLHKGVTIGNQVWIGTNAIMSEISPSAMMC